MLPCLPPHNVVAGDRRVLRVILRRDGAAEGQGGDVHVAVLGVHEERVAEGQVPHPLVVPPRLEDLRGDGVSG